MGGKSDDGDLMEAHRLGFVVAESEADAKNHAKARWNAIDMHGDGVRKLDEVYGYRVILKKKEDDMSQAERKQGKGMLTRGIPNRKEV